MDISLSKLQEVVKDREAWRAAAHGVTKSRHNWETEQQISLYSRLKGNFPKDMTTSWPSQSVNVTSFGQRIFADINKSRVLNWDQLGLSRDTLNLMTSVFIGDTQERDTEKREGHVKEAEAGAM